MDAFEKFDAFDGFEEEGQKSIDFMPYVRKALRHWKKILIWAFAGSLFGIMIGFSVPKTFTARAVVAPELATRSTLSSGLNSLASLAGVNMNNLALTDAMHPDLYPEVINSTSMYISLFDMPVVVETKDSLVHTDLYDYMVSYNKHPWWTPVFGLPRTTIEMVKGWFKEKNEYEDTEGHESMDSLRLTKQQENVIKALRSSVSASVEKKTYVLSVRVTMQDRIIAAQVANKIIDNLKNFVIEYRTEKSRENVEYYTKVAEETRAAYLAAQKAYASYADSHQGFSNKSTRIYEQQLQNEAQLRYQMYNQTVQSLLSAEAKVQHESPVLVIVQSAMAPNNGKPSRVRLAVLWFVLGGALGVAWVLWKGRKETE